MRATILLLVACCGFSAPAPPLEPVVEVEETVYSVTAADNGAGPLWCSGSTCLVRVGEDVFASGLETLPDARPLNNCRWLLFHRGAGGWEQVQVDASGRTREPCPVVGFRDGRLFLSGNPTLVTNREAYSGPARPEILQFAATEPRGLFHRLMPAWQGSPAFTEHSYRSFAADGIGRELILFQNIGYTHAEWTFLDRDGRWSGQGQIKWPWGAGYERPQPIRVCYPNVALHERAVHFCGVSDILEPYAGWRAYKKEITGREWDYDFRRLFYTWTPDITRAAFRDWTEIASRDRTAGWISPGDLWVGPDGGVHVLWTERAIDERLRAKFFPGEKQRHALEYALLREGKVVRRLPLSEAVEGEQAQEIPGRGRFQVTPEGRLFAVFYVSGRSVEGGAVSENRVLELLPGGGVGALKRLPLKQPLTDFFTATVRGGSPPSRRLELLGQPAGGSDRMVYVRVRLY